MKTLIVVVLRFLSRVFSILPLESNKVLLFSYGGRQYSCNPKYISRCIGDHYPGQFAVVWAFENPEEHVDLVEEGIKVVKYRSLRFVFHFYTSKFIITNDGFKTYLNPRLDQCLIQTWHGGGAYKKVGQSLSPQSRAEKGMMHRGTFVMSNASIYISSCREFTERVIRESFGYRGEVLEIGMPRNDLFFSPNRTTSKVRDQLDIPREDLMVVYAPTYRRDFSTDAVKDFDYKQIAGSFREKYQKDVTFVCRAHHGMNSEDISVPFVVDASNYPDMQEILLEADILITDYSSSMWDFSLMYKPCFIYATDINRYESEQGFYTPIEEWPFPIATNNDALVKNIISFDQERYVDAVRNHHDELGSFETGEATKTVVEYMRSILND